MTKSERGWNKAKPNFFAKGRQEQMTAECGTIVSSFVIRI